MVAPDVSIVIPVYNEEGILREAITARTIDAMVLILGAVLMIQLAPGAHGRSAPPSGRGVGATRREKAGV